LFCLGDWRQQSQLPVHKIGGNGAEATTRYAVHVPRWARSHSNQQQRQQQKQNSQLSESQYFLTATLPPTLGTITALKHSF